MTAIRERTKRTMTAIRIPPDQLAEIDRRAESYGMTRTSYLIAAALEELPQQHQAKQDRLERIEERLDHVEARMAEKRAV